MQSLIEISTAVLKLHRDVSRMKIQAVIAYLEERDRLAYLAWYRATRDLKGEWGHVTQPLFEDWQDAGAALQMMERLEAKP